MADHNTVTVDKLMGNHNTMTAELYYWILEDGDRGTGSLLQQKDHTSSPINLLHLMTGLSAPPVKPSSSAMSLLITPASSPKHPALLSNQYPRDLLPINA